MANSESKIELQPQANLPQETNAPSPARHAPGGVSEDDKTVLDRDLYQNGSSAQENVKIVDPDPDSGTKTALHSPQNNGAADDLENQKTVITKRPQAMPPHITSPRDLGSLLEGEQLGHFRLDQFVGGGGMGAVFRGTDLQLGRTVAVKVLSRDQGADAETLKRFKNEAQSAARLDHDNIARVFFVGEHDGWNFIVFEYIEGENLRDLVEQNGPMSLETAIDYAVQIAEALEHAAARDVVHRDIKPSNVLIATDGHAKLVDMGLARLHHMEAGHSDLTASGVTLGTFDYISPEQASDPRRADVRSDLYSLGCTLYFMLVGRPPFPHGTVLQKLLAHSGEAPPDPRETDPDLPPELSDIISRLLAKRPADRYQQSREFVSEMLLLRDQLGFGDSRLSLADYRRRRASWREVFFAYGIPALLLVAILFGLEAYWQQAAMNAPPPGFNIPEPSDVAGDESETDANSSEAATDSTNGSHNESESADTVTENEGNNGGGAAQRTDRIPPGHSEDAPSTGGSTTTETDSPESEGGASTVTDTDTGDANESPEEVASPENGDVRIERIIIGDASVLGDPGGDARIFATLGEAFASEDFRQNLEHIDAIEVRSQRLVEEKPIRVDLPADKLLVIRGKSAGVVPPEIIFSVSASEAPGSDWGMFEFTSGRLLFEELHLKLVVDSDHPTLDDLALVRFTTAAKKQLEMSKCVVTIENPAEELAGTVAAFDVVASEEEEPHRLPIHLRDCIVRGQATTLRMRESMPVQFVWNNGLLATSERLLLAEGSPHKFEDTIRLSLLNVTADVGRGLCLLRDSNAKPHQPGLELVCNKSIITALGSNLVEHDGVGEVDDYKMDSLFLRGDYNVYEDVATFWQISASDGSEPGYDWPAWSERMRMGGGMPSSVSPIGWRKLRSDVSTVPFHQRRDSDYLIDPEEPGAASTGEVGVPNICGLNSEALPQLPAPITAQPSPEPKPVDAT